MKRHPTLPHFVPGRGYDEADWNEVSDNPELTDEELAKGRPFAEVFPEWAAQMRASRGRPKLEKTKKQVTLRLDADLIELFRAEGPGWQSRINETLRKAKGL
jgi:uncharacterized protein (DUF4415 family)